MPLMRNASSTVAQELDLVRTFLDIVRIRLGERLAFKIDVPPSADTLRMPPMMLLPLVDHAIVRGLEPSSATGNIRIGTEIAEGRLRLRIADTGAGFVPEKGEGSIRDIRERLQALYGGNGRLDLRRHIRWPQVRSLHGLPTKSRAWCDSARPFVHSARPRRRVTE